MKLIEIEVNESKCVSCRNCELICSYLYFSEFNPSKARIQVSNEYTIFPTISFKEDCNHCGQCVLNCLYGALKIKQEV
jgi:Fe-S-cluster-containing dehydrogenase component